MLKSRGWLVQNNDVGIGVKNIAKAWLLPKEEQLDLELQTRVFSELDAK